MKKITLLLWTSLAVAAVGRSAQANMLQNGSFELPGTGCTAGATSLPGWTVTMGNIDTVNVGCTDTAAASGKYFLDLTGSFGAGAGEISQSVLTKPGREYTLTFFFGANAQWQKQPGNPFSIYPNDGPVKAMDLLIDGSQLGDTYSIDTTGQAWNSAGWIPETATFTAGGLWTEIAFESLNGADGTVYGPLLDGVTLEPTHGRSVPEPTSLALLGAGLIGIAFSRRRRA